MNAIKTYSQAARALRLALDYLGKASAATAKFDGVFERTAQAAALRLVGQRISYVSKIAASLPDVDGPIDAKTKAQVELSLDQSQETLALIDRLGNESTNFVTDFLANLAVIVKDVATPIVGAAFSLTWPLLLLAGFVGGLYLLFIFRKA